MVSFCELNRNRHRIWLQRSFKFWLLSEIYWCLSYFERELEHPIIATTRRRENIALGINKANTFFCEHLALASTMQSPKMLKSTVSASCTSLLTGNPSLLISVFSHHITVSSNIQEPSIKARGITEITYFWKAFFRFLCRLLNTSTLEKTLNLRM